MNKFPLPNSVLIVDNASIHKVAGIQEMVEECGVRLMYLLPYSPDLNPIELVFLSIKACLRANRNHLDNNQAGSVYNAVWQAVHSISTESAQGWYKHCGYIQEA
jgi:transposase